MVALVCMAVLNPQAAFAAGGGGSGRPPYSDSWQWDDQSCSGSASCEFSGTADHLTGKLGGHASIDVAANPDLLAEDGSGWDDAERGITQQLVARSGTRSAVVTLVIDVTEATASVSGDSDPNDEAWSYLDIGVDSSNCWCGSWTTVQLADTWENFERAPGEMTVKLAVSVPSWDTTSQLGLLNVGAYLTTFAEVNSDGNALSGRINSTSVSVDGLPDGVQGRSASTSAELTIKSIKLTNL